MKRAVDHGAINAVGYTVPWSAKAGQQINLSLSCDLPIKNTRISRLARPVTEFPAWPIEAIFETAEHRQFDQGSFLRVPADELAKRSVHAIRFELFLTGNPGSRTVLEAGSLRLCLRDGAFVLDIGDDVLLAEEKAPLGVWLTVELDHRRGELCLCINSHDLLVPYELDRCLGNYPWRLQSHAIHLGACASRNEPNLNAKFAAIRPDTSEGLLAWDFPTLLPREPILSSGGADPLRLDVVNQPAICITSARRNGSSFDPRLAATHYDAIHCHDDEIGLLQWPPSHRVTVPENSHSGVYAFQVEWEVGYERVVFFVNSSRALSLLLYLVPTATYLAYADECLANHLYQWKCDDRGHRFAIANNLNSLYDYHSNLSGVSICSYKKPKDDFAYPLCGCPHNLPVDLHFLRFCHENGFVFDGLTDHLHEGGIDGLHGYRAIVTGSHPEYTSIGIEQALRQFVTEGGSIAYLGDKGFAGVVASKDDLMELRRLPLEARRTGDSPIAEQSLSITNQPGGYLRSRGRGEFSLIGAAISLMGFDGARPSTRTDESYQAGCAWLFEGVDNWTFGSPGIVLGAAAGYEVDATSPALGTSRDTIIIACATDFPDSFVHHPRRWYEGGDPERVSRPRAEMTLRNLAAGGFVFSASSVGWCGALPAANGMNDVGKITLNLLNRLSAPHTARTTRESGKSTS